MPIILIIDDHPRLLATLRLALQDDFEVLTATSGEEGLKIIRQEKPDLVLLDYALPGLDGLQVLERLQAWPEAPPVFLMSARMERELCRQAKRLGAADCVEKPFDLFCLREMIAGRLQ